MASIRKRTVKSGKTTWAVLYRHGAKQTSTTFETEKAALDFKSLVEVLGPDRALAVLQEDQPPQMLTVAELAEKFLEWKRRDVTERTFVDYQRTFRRWILPDFGHRAADMIDERDIQKWVEHMSSEGLSPKTVAGHHVLLSSMYRFGVARTRRLVTHNPCGETELPKRHKKPPKGTTIAEYRMILEAAEARNPDAADFICFMAETGWRWSEAAALLVGDVVEDDAGVSVTLSGVFRVDGEGRQVRMADEAKSYRAFRPVRLFSRSAAVVRRRVVGLGAGDYVFTNGHGNHWNQVTFLRETWPRILEDADLWHGAGKSHTPHSLRHMHVGICSAAGMAPQEIQRRIGHESIQTTMNVYGGMIGDASPESMRRASELMAGRGNRTVSGTVVRGEIG